VAAYTAYFIDQNRHVARALLEAVSDEEAGREAAALVDSGTVELWAGPRRVGSFNGRGPVKPLAPPLPETRDAWLTEAIALHRAGKFAEAAELYAALLKAEPENSKVLGLLGTLNYRRGEFQEALRSLELSLKLDPQQPFTLTISGNTLCRLGRYREAVAAYQKAIALKADHAAAHSNLGNALVALNRPIEALASCEKAIAIRPNDSESHSCRGNALRALRRHAEALASCDKAIELNPNNAVAYLNRARTYAALHRLAEAADDYDKSIALDPSNAEAHKHGGDLCRARRAYQEALALYDNAITLRPDYAAAHYARGNALGKLKRYGEALDSIDTARALDASLSYAWGNRLSIKARICDWDGFPEESRDLVAAIGRGELGSTPFAFLSLPSTPGAQRRCAELYANDRYPPPSLPDRNATKSAWLMPHDRIRVAYVSSTYYTHAGSTLLVGILEQHDRSKFEIYGISMSPNEESDFRNRIEKSLDHFIDVSERSDAEVAAMLRDLEIDIAVDLRGYTNNSRPGVFTHRAAPIQVNFLGFAGTTGAASMDYIIADRIVIPPEERA
jgi:predicted O-linked N-acetylglucosamine transferase (SPINDLY family)